MGNLMAYSKASGQFFDDITGGALPAKRSRPTSSCTSRRWRPRSTPSPPATPKASSCSRWRPTTWPDRAGSCHRHDKAAGIKGDPNDDAANLRAALTDKLTAHVYLAGVGVFTAYTAGADSPEFAAAGAALDENSVEISQAVGSLAGSKQVQASSCSHALAHQGLRRLRGCRCHG